MNDEPQLTELGKMLVKALECKPLPGFGYNLERAERPGGVAAQEREIERQFEPQEEESDHGAQSQAKTNPLKVARPPSPDALQADLQDVRDRDEELDGTEELEMPQFPFFILPVPLTKNDPRPYSGPGVGGDA